jgi:hypothetical protein
MRAMLAGLFLFGLGACAQETCVTTTSLASPSCSERDGGDARVVVRPYTALDEVFVEGCQVTRGDAGLVVSATTRVCPAGASTGALFADCAVPPLPPGRYPLGAATLVVPADSGFTRCE